MEQYFIKEFFNGKGKWLCFNGIFAVSPQFVNEFKSLHVDAVEVIV